MGKEKVKYCIVKKEKNGTHYLGDAFFEVPFYEVKECKVLKIKKGLRFSLESVDEKKIYYVEVEDEILKVEENELFDGQLKAIEKANYLNFSRLETEISKIIFRQNELEDKINKKRFIFF